MRRWPAMYFDGETAKPNPIEVAIGPASLILYDGQTVIARWTYDGLRRVYGSNVGPALLELTPVHGSDERVRLDDPGAIAALRKAHRKVDARPAANRSAIGRALFWTGVAVGGVAFIMLVAIPALAPQIAAMIPPEKEVALGEQTERLVKKIGLFDRVCAEPEGVAALDKMVATLTDDIELRIPVHVDVAESVMVNAFALPGGRVLIMEPLIAEADSAEEVAGVLAHEIGHVQNSDSTRELIRSSASAGMLGLFFGDFFGAGVIAGVGEHMANMSYTRDAERNADDFAIERLTAAGIDTEPMAGFFRRFRDQGGGGQVLGGYLDSHPGLAERAKKLADASLGADARPILTDAEWKALRNICEDREDANEGDDGETTQ